MKRLLAALASILALVGVSLVVSAGSAEARVVCNQFAENDTSQFTVIDYTGHSGPVPVVIPIVVMLETNVGYDWCFNTENNRDWIVPTFVHAYFRPLSLRDTFTCETFRRLVITYSFGDGHGDHLNPNALVVPCHPEGGNSFEDINNNRAHLVPTADFGWPKGRAEIKAVHDSGIPDRHPDDHTYRLNPFGVIDKDAPH